MGRHDFPLEGDVEANGSLQCRVLSEKRGDKCSTHIYLDGLGRISPGGWSDLLGS